MRQQILTPPQPPKQYIIPQQRPTYYQPPYQPTTYRRTQPAFVLYKQPQTQQYQYQYQSSFQVRQSQPVCTVHSQQIYQPSPVRQQRNSIHQQPIQIVNSINPQYSNNYRQIFPSNSQQQQTQPQTAPRYSVQKPQTFTLPNPPPQQIFPQQNYQHPQKQQLQQQTPQIKTTSPVIAQQEDELEKRFQDAIDRTRDLVQKYNPADQNKQQQQQQQQQYQQQQQQQLTQLALQYEDGFIYRGQGYEPAVREGFGVLTDQYDNEVFSGYWKDNQYHGQGKLINFQVDQIEGPYDYRDLGNIENGWMSYEGDFYEGKMHGKGVLVLTNGEQFEGEFNDGMIDGQGIYSTSDRHDIRGVWKDGILVE
ncbi:unnamed protein product [Paramecium sonneborni]|uniref:MORN repeat protein n=1 Tax=Paramecium sonneborni TaxID=65129 RepID=A0A8S1MU79_9CILI|nr:unnamed protein product [Paramecium sonneborni]